MNTTENNDKKTKHMSFQLSKAYLELSRSFFKVPIIDDLTENTFFALMSMTYVFSYAAIVAFVNGQIGQLWYKNESALKKKYPQQNINILLHKDLRELKKTIKELCIQHDIKILSEAKPQTWNDLLQVVKIVRDYIIHPKPNPQDFQEIMKKAFQNRTWNFPSKVAEEVIGYFYEQTGNNIPSWIRENTEFEIDSIRTLIKGSEEIL